VFAVGVRRPMFVVRTSTRPPFPAAPTTTLDAATSAHPSKPKPMWGDKMEPMAKPAWFVSDDATRYGNDSDRMAA
jgi:hypothetical protein